MAKAKKSMAHPLYLTADERKLFDVLPEKLKEGWEVKGEKGRIKDSPQQRVLRAMFLHVEHPSLRELQQKAKQGLSDKEFVNLCRKIDLNKVPQTDLAELFFVVGSEGMSVFTSVLLQQAKNDDDLDSIAALSAVRRAFIESSQKIS